MMIRFCVSALGILWLVFAVLGGGAAFADDSQPAYPGDHGNDTGSLQDPLAGAECRGQAVADSARSQRGAQSH